MKPPNWDTMTPEKKSLYAQRLVISTRGQLVMGRALAVAVKALRKENHPELSDIQDIEIIGECIFPQWFNYEMEWRRVHMGRGKKKSRKEERTRKGGE
jgi:hypothetical protein